MTGIVKFYNTDKGYGFINETGTSNDYFFHYTSCYDQLEKGDKVKFDIMNGPKGMLCVKIELEEDI